MCEHSHLLPGLARKPPSRWSLTIRENEIWWPSKQKHYERLRVSAWSRPEISKGTIPAVIVNTARRHRRGSVVALFVALRGPCTRHIPCGLPVFCVQHQLIPAGDLQSLTMLNPPPVARRSSSLCRQTMRGSWLWRNYNFQSWQSHKTHEQTTFFFWFHVHTNMQGAIINLGENFY